LPLAAATFSKRSGAIDPICDKGYEIVREANKLGRKALDAYAANFVTFAARQTSP
jgi:hypothetical protein